MTPEKRMVQKIQNYDKNLFVVWNNRHSYFELWRKQSVGSVLITPITQSIYDIKKTKTYTDLDERLLWWIYEADSWRQGGAKKHALEQDKRWQDWQINMRKASMSNIREFAKDAWHSINNFYTSKAPKTNPRLPTFAGHRKNTWIRPDIKSNMNSRLMSRSRANALAYDYQR